MALRASYYGLKKRILDKVLGDYDTTGVMTNKELTEINTYQSTTLEASSDERITNADAKAVYKYGKVVNLLLQFKCTETTLNTEITAFTLPEIYRPHAVRAFRTWDIGTSCTDENQEIVINPNGTVVLKIRNTHNTARWICLDCTFITSN